MRLASVILGLAILAFSQIPIGFFEDALTEKARTAGLAILGLSLFVHLLLKARQRVGDPQRGAVRTRRHALYCVIWPWLVSGLGFFLVAAAVSLFFAGIRAQRVLVAGVALFGVFLLIGVFQCANFLWRTRSVNE
jgi:hypothetical protein